MHNTVIPLSKIIAHRLRTGVIRKYIFLWISILFMSIIFISCKKVYRDEIFNGQYDIIYGNWQHISTASGVNGTIINQDPFTILFTPIGKFSFNNGKTGIIYIKQQDENALILDFNSLFPDVSRAYIRFKGNDTISIDDTGTNPLFRQFKRVR